MRRLLSYLVTAGRWVRNAADVVAIELVWGPIAEWWHVRFRHSKNERQEP